MKLFSAIKSGGIGDSIRFFPYSGYFTTTYFLEG